MHHTERSNRVLLSMLSPVWRAKLCGGPGTDRGWALDMSEEDASVFLQVVTLGCGKSVVVAKGLEGLIELLRMADWYQVEAIQGEVEEAVMDRLSVESCGRILTTTCGSGLVRLERASRSLALSEFDQFAECAGLMEVNEEVLGSLLDDDALVSESEERVLKIVVRWMRGGGEGVIRGEGLLRKIRFPFMSAEFLACEARSMLPKNTGLEALVLESILLKSIDAYPWAHVELEYLDAAVLVPRRGTCGGMGVNWAEYAGGGESRRSTHGNGFVSRRLRDGSICQWVWNGAIMEVDRTLTRYYFHGMLVLGCCRWGVGRGIGRVAVAGHMDS
jgi:hypothetical protein